MAETDDRGFTIKISGGGLTLREYRCPEHGVFETLVERDAGDEQPCPVEPCGETSPRCFTSAPAVHTQFVASASQGKSDPKPHRLSLDTRPLAEGMRMSEWKRERKALWEEQRHARVKEMLQ